MICVECGREAVLQDGACGRCLRERIDLVKLPPHTVLEACAHCRARHEGAHWIGVPDDEPDEWILMDCAERNMVVHEALEGLNIEWQQRVLDKRNIRMTAHVTGNLLDEPIQETQEMIIRRQAGVCDRCSRMQGGYYAAILQLRATERDVSSAELEIAHAIVAGDLQRQLDAGNRQAFLSKDGPMHGGHDYFVGDIDAGRNVSRLLKEKLGASVQESAKLVGRKEGEDVYRVTFLIRIAPFSRGDLVVDEKPFVVVQVNQKDLAVLDLERYRRDRHPFKGMTRLGGVEILEEAVVVSQDASELQILDPVSFQPVALSPPPWEIGDTCWVLRYEEKLYAAPKNVATLK